MSGWPSAGELPWLAESDKVLHFGIYAVLGALLAHGRRRSGSAAPHWALVGLGALYGASDEWHQSFVPGRDPSAADWVADVGGLLLGYALAWAVFRSFVPGDAAPDPATTTERTS